MDTIEAFVNTTGTYPVGGDVLVARMARLVHALKPPLHADNGLGPGLYAGSYHQVHVRRPALGLSSVTVEQLLAGHEDPHTCCIARCTVLNLLGLDLRGHGNLVVAIV